MFSEGGSTLPALCAIVLALAATPLRAQAPLPAVSFVRLPSPSLPVASDPDGDPDRNFQSRGMGILDVVVDDVGQDRVRVMYTTEGRTEEPVSGIFVVHPGRLRFVDFLAPFPRLESFDGIQLPSPEVEVRAPVSGWNDVLNPQQLSPPPAGKTSTILGITSVHGTVFVNGGATRNDQGLGKSNWNGLSVLDGTMPAASAFDSATGELYTTRNGAYLGPLGIPSGPPDDCTINLPEFATPEGSIAVTTAGGRLLFVPNYCGNDAAGFLNVQDITNITSLDACAKVGVDLYGLLGNYLLSFNDNDAYGPEVDLNLFQQIAGSYRGNKIRALTVVRVPQGFPNARRLLLFIALNTDPLNILDIDFGAQGPQLDDPLDGLFIGGSWKNRGTDDGRYDYVAVIDITQLTTKLLLPAPAGSWSFWDQAEWAARTVFLRLPPDLPVGWHIDNAPSMNPPLLPGHDWSLVDVTEPDAVGAPVAQQERIVGSGTPATMTADPIGRAVYLVRPDPGQQREGWPSDPFVTDGGWQMPHLVVLDLAIPGLDWTDQQQVHAVTDQIVTQYRLPKQILSDFTPGWGGAFVPSDLPGWPASPGTAHPGFSGEHQFDPTPMAKLMAMQNAGFLSDPTRLYLGLNGLASPVGGTENAILWKRAGVLAVLSLDDPVAPSYPRTITFPGNLALDGSVTRQLEVRGLDLVAPEAQWLGSQPGDQDRNVYLVVARDQNPLNLVEDRLVVGQDTN